jgi:DNA-binding FadR family transcriptional regulator
MHALVVDHVGEAIVSGRLTAGAVIEMSALESELGASRSVVREAIRVLADKGLVYALPKRGTVVRDRESWSLLDPDLLRWQYESRTDTPFLSNLAEVRAIVEPAAAALAAQRRTDDDLAAMQRALEQMEDTEADAAAIVEADVAFHGALLVATHNDLLQRMELVIQTALRARDELVHGSATVENSAQAHRDVLDAIVAEDPNAAHAAVESLLAVAVEDEARIGARSEEEAVDS